MGCGYEIVLRKNISYGRTYFSGVHIFQDDMSYESICHKGGHALLEEMFYGRSCIGGVHVFRMAYHTCVLSCFVRGNVLWEVMYWWSACLQDGISYMCFVVRHVLLEGMFFLRVCIIKGHVLQSKMSYGLLVGMSYRKPCIT